MEVKAYAKSVKVSPKKARLICREFSGKPAKTALAQLQFQPQKSAKLVYKLLHSALANAEHNFNLKSDNLVIARLSADKGPVYKRMWARGRGRADRILKPTSHLTVILQELTPSQPVVEPKVEVAETKKASAKPKAKKEEVKSEPEITAKENKE